MSTPVIFDVRSYERSSFPRKFIRDLPATERPLHRFQYAGRTAVSTVELLAITLGSPDALDLAGEVLATIRNLPRLLTMSVGELTRFRGIGKKRAIQLLAAVELGKRAYVASLNAEEKYRVVAPSDAAAMLMPRIMDLKQEHFVVMTLNSRRYVQGFHTLYRGNVHSISIRGAEVFRPAIVDNCPGIIVAHNHPSGDPEPSPEDVTVTRELVAAAKVLEISLMDHIIIGRNRFVSLRERGEFDVFD